MTSRTLIERVALALNSSDLRLMRYACDLDKVIVSGWASRSGQLGALAFWSKYTVDPQRTRELMKAVKRIAIASARRRKRGGSIDELNKVAEASLFYWLTDRCPTCQGRGFIVLESKQTVSDLVCETCYGSGLRPMPTPIEAGVEWDAYQLQRTITELLGILDTALSAYVGTTLNALKNDEPMDQARKIFKSDAK